MLNLREYRSYPHRLADYLPWAALVAPGVVLNKDGCFQRSARFRGPDLESATQSELVSAVARINNALRRFGSGWSLFFEARRQPAGAYPVSAFPDPLAALVDEERRADFEETGSLFESRYFLTFVHMPPADQVNRAARVLLDAGDADNAPGARDTLATFLQETERALDLLRPLMPELVFLDDAETLTYLHDCISCRHQKISVPEIPLYLDAMLVDTDLIGGLAPKLGDHFLRTLTVLGFPGNTVPGLLDDLNHLGFAYRWVTRFIALDKTAAQKVLARCRRQWFAKRKSVAAILREVMTNEPSVLADSDADNKAMDADAALQELGSDLVAYGYVTITVTVSDPDVARADEQIRAVRRIIDSRGFTSIEERLNAVEAWLSSLPGQVYANVRQAPINTLNLAHMMPLSASWAGPAWNDHLDGPPLLTVRSHETTPFRLVSHVGDVGHSLVLGPTGAGKSVLLALMVLQFRRYDRARVVVFDKGGSARAVTLGLGGAYYDLGLDGATRLAFQPLRHIDDLGVRAFAQDWIGGLLIEGGEAATADSKDALWSALGNLASAPVHERTLTGLAALLQPACLRSALKPYTLEGPYGRLLDADKETLALGDVQCFEMEALMLQKSAVLPVLTYLFHRLETGFDGRPTLLILDEAWLFLDHPAFAARIRDWLKTLRKKNVAVIFATQSLADIASSTIAPAIVESCPSRIFLPNDRALEPQMQETYRAFGLNDRQIDIIGRAVPKREYYFQSRQGNRLFELGLGPVALAFAAAASKDDHARMDAILAADGSAHFAERWLVAQGLDWAAALIQDMRGD